MLPHSPLLEARCLRCREGDRGKAWKNSNIKFLFKKQINFKKIAFVIQITQNTMLHTIFWPVVI